MMLGLYNEIEMNYEQKQELPSIGKMYIPSTGHLELMVNILSEQGYIWTNIPPDETLSRIEVLYWEDKRKSLTWSPLKDIDIFDEPLYVFGDYFTI